MGLLSKLLSGVVENSTTVKALAKDVSVIADEVVKLSDDMTKVTVTIVQLAHMLNAHQELIQKLFIINNSLMRYTQAQHTDASFPDLNKQTDHGPN
jgi:hypothetical protein